jgi:hypothetical protein
MRKRSIITLLFMLTFVLAGFGSAGTAAAQDTQCFPETGGHCVSGRFLEYWRQNGGLPVFGYPIGPAQMELNKDTGQTYLTQWFERNRFELHPENGRPYDVLLGRLGNDRLVQQGRDWFSFLKDNPSAPHYFSATGHAIAETFWGYWSSHGLDLGDGGTSERESLALWGLPLSEPAMETNASGDTVLTQWFERARFEYHPNKPAEFQVLLGLLGGEVRAGLPPDLCANIPLPDSGRINRACPRQGQLIIALAYGFAPDEQLQIWLQSPDGMAYEDRGRTRATRAGEQLVLVDTSALYPAGRPWTLVVTSASGARRARICFVVRPN